MLLKAEWSRCALFQRSSRNLQDPPEPPSPATVALCHCEFVVKPVRERPPPLRSRQTTIHFVRDLHPDEHATRHVVRGRGLVVISSCGHTSIINTVGSAMAAASVGRLHAVLGGFHLGLAPREYLR